MAIAFDAALGTRNAAGGGQNPTVTTGTAAASGARIFLVVSWLFNGETLSSVSGGSLTWTVDQSGIAVSSTLSIAIASAPAPNGLPSPTTITASFSAAPADSAIISVFSATGVDLSPNANARDAAPVTATNATAATAWVTPTITTTSQSTFIVGCCVSGDSGTATNTPTIGQTEVHDQGNVTLAQSMVTEYRIPLVSGNYTMGGTWTASARWACIGVAYKPAAGGGLPPIAGITNPTMQMGPATPPFKYQEPTYPARGPDFPSLPDPSRYLNPLTPALGTNLSTFQLPTYPALGPDFPSLPPDSKFLNPLSPTLGQMFPTQTIPFIPAVDIILQAGIGNLLLTSDASVVLESMAPSIGNLVLTSDASVVSEAVLPSIGVLTLTADANTVSEAVTAAIGILLLNADTSTVNIGGSPVTVTQPSPGNLVLTADTATVLESMSPVIGNLSLQGMSPTLVNTLNATQAVLILTADTPQIQEAIGPPIGTIVLTGDAANISNRSINATVGILILTSDPSSTSGGSGPSIETSVRQYLFYIR